MVAEDYWLKPVMLTLGICAFVMLLIILEKGAVFPGVEWTAINNTVIGLLPWLIAFGVALSVLIAVTRR